MTAQALSERTRIAIPATLVVSGVLSAIGLGWYLSSIIYSTTLDLRSHTEEQVGAVRVELRDVGEDVHELERDLSELRELVAGQVVQVESLETRIENLEP